MVESMPEEDSCDGDGDGSDSDLPSLAEIFGVKTASISNLSKGVVKGVGVRSSWRDVKPDFEMRGDLEDGEEGSSDIAAVTVKKKKKRVLKPKTENPLLRPLMSDGMKEGRSKERLDVSTDMNGDEGKLKTKTVRRGGLQKEAANNGHVGVVSRVLEESDVSGSEVDDTQMVVQKRMARSQKKTPEVSITEESEEVDITSDLYQSDSELEPKIRSRRMVQRTVRPAVLEDSESDSDPDSINEISESHSDEDDEDDEDGDLSDFIVDDNETLDEDESISEVPPPRSARRLVRGRRPAKKVVDSDDEDDLDLKMGRLNVNDISDPFEETLRRDSIAVESDPFDELLRRKSRSLGRNASDSDSILPTNLSSRQISRPKQKSSKTIPEPSSDFEPFTLQ